MTNKHQQVYDEWQAEKSRAAAFAKDRHEGLILDSDEYEGVVKEIERKSEIRRKIELDWEEKHPELMSDLNSAKERAQAIGEKLALQILAAIKAGEKVEIFRKTKRGKRKAVSPHFKVSFGS